MDELLDFWGMNNDTSSDDNMLDFWEEIKEEVIETPTEVTEEVAAIETPTTEWDESSDADIDLDSIFEWLEAEVENSNEALDKLETAGWDMEDVWSLRDSLKRMEDQIKKLNNNNADLKFRNAELSAFSIEDSDPKVMVIARNFSKAIWWDDKAKAKVVSTLKDMIYDLTGEDFDDKKVAWDIDLLTASEMYNNEINPNLKEKNSKDYGWIEV